MNETTIRLLENVADEIEQLRHENAILRARVDTMNLFRLALDPQSRYMGGEAMTMGIDRLWEIRDHVEWLRAQDLERDPVVSPKTAAGPGGEVNEVPVGLDPTKPVGAYNPPTSPLSTEDCPF